MMITVLYFARLRETLGLAREELALPEDVRDVAALMTFLGARGGAWQEVFGNVRQIRAAINQELANGPADIKAGDEVAFFPPVTGG